MQFEKMYEDNQIVLKNKEISVGGKNEYLQIAFSEGNTLLSWAVKEANLENITKFLQKGLDVNEREAGGATPLLLAVHLNRVAVVNLLIQYGAAVNIGDSYDTPLTAAVRRGYLKIIKLLMDKGAKIDVVTFDRLSPVFWAIQNENLEILELLVSRGIPENLKNNHGDAPLIYAVKNGSSEKIIQFLLKSGAKIKEVALVWAVKNGYMEFIKIFINNGADGNMLGSDGNTLLATAVRHKQFEIVKYLTMEGMNVCKVGTNGKSPLLWAVENQDLDMITWLLDHGAEYIVDTVLGDGIKTKNLQIFRLLYERQTKINRSFDPAILLTQAFDVESIDIMTFLLRNGASLNDGLRNRATYYLVKFVEQDNREMVELMTENGAEINQVSSCGHTPLTKSIQMENFEMVKLFVQNNANLNLPNRYNRTPLALASSINDFRTFQYLVEFGANIENDPMRNNERLVQHYEIAVETISKRTKFFLEHTSNQEAEEQEEKPGLSDEPCKDVVEEKTLAQRNYYVIEFD